MTGAWEGIAQALAARPRRWVVTGGAGFIGSHLVEALLARDQEVVALDDLATGRRENLAHVAGRVGAQRAARLDFVQGDIRDPAALDRALEGAAVVLHQAALGSVPRSIRDPFTTHDVNVTGFVRVLEAARRAGIRRVVYASSSSVYGDHPALPKREEAVGHVLSPYAASKAADEAYAHAFGRAYGLELVGLRYFNVFGPRQDPHGPYAAVIPRWFAALRDGAPVTIHGDGETSRDFCHVENVVQVNLAAAVVADPDALGRVYNVACGERTTLNALFGLVRQEVARVHPEAADARPVYGEFRPGDVRHSLADVSLACTRLGYAPTHGVREGLREAAEWYLAGGA